MKIIWLHADAFLLWCRHVEVKVIAHGYGWCAAVEGRAATARGLGWCAAVEEGQRSRMATAGARVWRKGRGRAAIAHGSSWCAGVEGRAAIAHGSGWCAEGKGGNVAIGP